jgi:hypothetical protein
LWTEGRFPVQGHECKFRALCPKVSNQEEYDHSDVRLGCGRKQWRNESSTTARKCTANSRTEQQHRHIVVEEHSDGVFLIVYEVRRTKDEYGSTTGHELHPVLRKRYLTLEEGISAAETVFDCDMNLGFREIIADTKC